MRDEADTPDPLRGRALARLALFADAYGVAAPDRARIADAVIHTYNWCYRIVRRAVHSGHDAFGQMWLRDGGALRADRTRRWIEEHRDEVQDALALSAGRA